MNRISRLLQAIAPNLVPAGGWFLAGWQPSTTLIVYWAENLTATLAIAIRILLHRRATRKRGHEGAFFSGFLVNSLAFTFVHGVFLAFILFGLLGDTIDGREIIGGLRWMLMAQLVTLAVDLVFLRGWPFAEVKVRTDWVLARVLVVHMAILVGMFVSAGRAAPTTIFPIFIGLKTLVDVGTLLPQWNPKDPPRWMSRIADRLDRSLAKGKRTEPFEEFWRRSNQAEQAKREQDEQVMPEGA